MESSHRIIIPKMALSLLFFGIINAFISYGVVGCGDETSDIETEQQLRTLRDFLNTRSDLTTFSDLVEQSGVLQTLSDETQKVTIIAPVNEAFDSLSSETLDEIRATAESAKAFVELHIIKGIVPIDQLGIYPKLMTYSGQTLFIEGSGTNVLIGGAKVKEGNFEVLNTRETGLVHLLETVASDKEVQSEPSLLTLIDEQDELSTFSRAIAAAGLRSVLDGDTQYTIFAPTDRAFENLNELLGSETVMELFDDLDQLTELLQQHLIVNAVLTTDDLQELSEIMTLGGVLPISQEDGSIKIADVTVESEGVTARNGILYLISDVLLPKMEEDPTPEEPEDVITEDIFELLSADDRLSILATALNTTGLNTSLAMEGPFTVFAPTNVAFTELRSEIGETAYEALMNDPDQVTTLLNAHIIIGQELNRTRLNELSEVESLAGPLQLTHSNDEIRVNDILIEGNATVATNGVVYVVSSLIQLEMMDNIEDIAGNEAGTTAGSEAGTTAGSEAGTTAGSEAGTTAGSEAGAIAGNDVIPVAGATIDNQAGTQAGHQAGGDQAGNQAGGDQAGNQAGGDQAGATAGNERSGGDQAGGDQAGGDPAGGDQAGGDQAGITAGNEASGGDQAGITAGSDHDTQAGESAGNDGGHTAGNNGGNQAGITAGSDGGSQAGSIAGE